MEDEVTTGEETKETSAIETDFDVTTLDDAALDAQLSADDEGTPAQTDEEQPPEVKEEKQEEVQPEKVETVDEEKAKLEKQVKDKEDFIKRQAEEIGELRKQAQLLTEQISQVNQEELNNRYYEDPTTAVNEVLALREKEAAANRLLVMANIKENEVNIKQAIPDFEDLIEDISAVALNEGADAETVRAFKTNPYGAKPDLAIQLAKRVKLEKENKALTSKVAELEAKLKTAPEAALKKVETAARQVVTGATGKTGGAQPAKANIHQMTQAQLDEIINGPDED